MADSRLIRPLPKPPLRLKDYLMEDMSSCSSNGFKSYPRRSQCCTAVRFLHEFDPRKTHKKIYLRPPPLQTVIAAAVKRLQFPPTNEKKKKSIASSFLPRSFSKRIMWRTTFWKKKKQQPEGKEIVRWKSFDQLLKEDSEPSDRTITTTAYCKSKSCWLGSDFTASATGNSSEEEESNSEAVTMSVEVVSVNGGVVVTNGDVPTDSTTTTCSNQSADTNSKKQWSSEEKEQFSPVSVLDCPFDDEDEVSSPFQHRLDRMEGTKKKLLKKIQMFECLAKLEPVKLATRFASEPDSDTESSYSLDDKFISGIEDDEEEHEDAEEKEEEEEEKALALLHQTKASLPVKLNADKLLLDFFRERIAIDFASCGESSFDEGLIEEAGDWINERKPRGSFLEWGGESYVRDMEKGGQWKTLDQETEEVATEVENEVFGALLNQELLHIFPQ